jgi:hypothetical protein
MNGISRLSAGLLVTAGCLALLMPGCGPASSSGERIAQADRDLMEEQQALQSEVARLRQEVDGLRADLRAEQQEQGALCGFVDRLREDNKARRQENYELCSLVASLGTRTSPSDDTWRKGVEALRARLRQGPEESAPRLDLDAAMLRDFNRRHGRPEDAPAFSGNEYTVQIGDTPRAIAEAFGVTVDALRTANGIEGDEIRIGQRLTIPPWQGTAVAP